ncbi:hypothetical protein ARMGADRAFT_135317 [Armillaria gallica]|uniref:Uncharacterized protein n=1 Tax=Armillaria gallica TaxID=47427 RepID=A0A2H3CVV9_ARMGA|nr:hypothetical protein ARMGADRAFT_135317 [Armillaria gallica]
MTQCPDPLSITLDKQFRCLRYQHPLSLVHIQRRTLNDFDNTYSEDNMRLDGSTSALASSSVLNKQHHLQTRHQQLYRLRASLHVHFQLLDIVSSTREVLCRHFRKGFNVPIVVLKRRGKKYSYKNGRHTPFFRYFHAATSRLRFFTITSIVMGKITKKKRSRAPDNLRRSSARVDLPVHDSRHPYAFSLYVCFVSLKVP